MDPRYTSKEHTSNSSQNSSNLAPFIPSMMNQLSQLMQQQSSILYNQSLRARQLRSQLGHGRNGNMGNGKYANTVTEEELKLHSKFDNYDTSKYLQLQSYLASILSNPYYPGWMVGPGGLPYLPPCVGKLYELQQEYFHKLAIKQQKQIKKHLNKIKNLQKKKQKQIKKLKAKQKKIRDKEYRKMKRKKQKEKLAAQAKAEKAQAEKEQKEKDKEKENQNEDSTSKKDSSSSVKKLMIAGSEQFVHVSDIDDDKQNVIELESASESDDQDVSFAASETVIESEDDYESDDSDDVPVELGKLPVYRLIILWSIAPQKRSDTVDKDEFVDLAAPRYVLSSFFCF